MQSALEAFLTTSALAFMLTFVRMGTAVMIMPGAGDSFVPQNVRLHIAVALTFVMFPLVMPYLPRAMPPTSGLLMLIMMEFMVGLLFGTVARILMAATDSAGMLISISSGLGSAQLFNPQLASQGSLIGAFMSVTGVTVLMATDMHHLLFQGLVESYQLFPVGAVPDSGSMADLIARTVSAAFEVGVQVASPFIVMTLAIYVGMGVLSRLMPQVQVFQIALPIQILMSIVLLMLTLSAGILFWLSRFQTGMEFFLKSAGG
jgi:flagellar biosynthesis protein FliR